MSASVPRGVRPLQNGPATAPSFRGKVEERNLRMSVVEKLEEEKRKKEKAEQDAQKRLPVMIAASESLLKILQGFLAEAVQKGFATIEYGKTNLSWPLDTIPFQTLRLSIRGRLIEVTPAGGDLGSELRVNVHYWKGIQIWDSLSLIWDGEGARADNWKIVDKNKGLIQLTSESFDERLGKLIGF